MHNAIGSAPGLGRICGSVLICPQIPVFSIFYQGVQKMNSVDFALKPAWILDPR
jgi:hypothetical protein